MNVYGYVKDEPIKETQSIAPESFYAVGKIASENYIKIFSDLGLKTTILRLFNVYGPGQNMENLKQGMLSIFLAYIIKNEPVVVKGSLERFRDFIYIDDLIDALKLAVITQNIGGETFQIASNHETTIGEITEKLVKMKSLGTYYFEPHTYLSLPNFNSNKTRFYNNSGCNDKLWPW